MTQKEIKEDIVSLSNFILIQYSEFPLKTTLHIQYCIHVDHCIVLQIWVVHLNNTRKAHLIDIKSPMC